MNDNTPNLIRPLIFLDIDGVLNSLRTFLAFKKLQLKEVDPVAVNLMDRLVRETDADIVISSSWRIGKPVPYLQEVFRTYFSAPFYDCIIDKTPHLCGKRGDDIRDWLEAHPERHNYVIIDDDSDMLPSQKSRFVCTDDRVGFDVRDYRKALSILMPEHIDVGGLKSTVEFKKKFR